VIYIAEVGKVELPIYWEEYLETSKVFKNLPEDYYAAKECYNINPDEVMEELLTNLPETHAFRPYVAMLKANGSEEIAGIVEKEKINEQTPPEFMTS